MFPPPATTGSMGAPRKKSPDVGVAIRHFRYEAGLSQDGLADRMDVSPSYISMLESGKRYPSIETLIRLAVALDIPPGTLLDYIAERYLRKKEES